MEEMANNKKLKKKQTMVLIYIYKQLIKNKKQKHVVKLL